MLQGLDLSRFFFAVLSWTSLKFSLTTMNIAAILRCSNALHHIKLCHNIFTLIIVMMTTWIRICIASINTLD